MLDSQTPAWLGKMMARVLEGVVISFSRGSFRPGIERRSPTLQADVLLSEPAGNPHQRLGVDMVLTLGST